MSHQTTTTPKERVAPDGGDSGFGSADWELFTQGRHARLFNKFGAILHHSAAVEFTVWAPNAQAVSVIGDFNNWNPQSHQLERSEFPGVWRGAFRETHSNSAYKYHLISQFRGQQLGRLDPFGFRQAPAPEHHSTVWDLEYSWADHEWMGRKDRGSPERPISIYEVHLGSWRRLPEEGNRRLSFRETAPYLAYHLARVGFTHVLLLDVLEHGAASVPASAGLFAPASELGTPQDLMFLVDLLHQRGFGVLLNWTPAHFPDAEGGLTYFDGARLFEQSSWTAPLGRTRGHVFDFNRPEVRSFLLSSACFWLEKYHVDGLRMPSLGEVLYLDLHRQHGEWSPNVHGGREDLAGISFLRELNSEIHSRFPDRTTIAADATEWRLVSHPPLAGGLGFDFREDDHFSDQMVTYLGHDPYFRKFNHGEITSRSERAFAERTVLPVATSHTPAGRPSLLSRMSGDEWQRFANFRLLLGFSHLTPGKKLLFMGTELAQWQDWNPESSLDWHLVSERYHAGVERWVGDLNHVYRTEPALHEADCIPAGFEWVDRSDAERSTASFLRRDSLRHEVFLAVFNFTPVVRRNFRVGVRRSGYWREVLNSDAAIYGGSGQGNLGGVEAAPFRMNDLPQMLVITLPPLAVVLFKHQSDSRVKNW